MGRGNAKYAKDLHQQAYERLTKMQAFGESKKAAMAEGTAGDKIYSYNTYNTYYKHIKYFLGWVKETHPEITTLNKAEKLVPEWLQTRVDEGLSAWTISTEEAALNKFYGIAPTDPKRFEAPKRNRTDIKRSRGDAVRDRHFSVTNNNELVQFCRGTGLRRSELQALHGRDLITRAEIEAANMLTLSDADRRVIDDAMIFTDAKYYVFVRSGKGGRARLCPIVGKNADQIVARMRDTKPDEKVWQHVSSNADIHSYRAEYATAIYKQYARKIEDIPYDKVNKGTGKKFQGDVYVCRADEAGKKLDKAAMLLCSKALGHNRISVVADNYIRGL